MSVCLKLCSWGCTLTRSVLQHPVRGGHWVLQSRIISPSQNSISKIRTVVQMPRGDHEDFITIYKFNHIRTIAVLSRIKLAQTVLTTVFSSAMFYMAYVGSTTWTSAYYASGLSSFALLVLYLISHFSRRLIGYAWLNKSKDTLKIAYLTFWGRRKDRIFPLVSVQEIDETPQNIGNIFLKLRLRNSRKFFYFTLRGSSVLHREMFIYVFGMKCYRMYKRRSHT